MTSHDNTQAATRQVLETCLTDTKAAYLKLLTQPGTLDQCREAGKTVRRLAECLAAPNDLDDYDEEVDDFQDGELNT